MGIGARGSKAALGLLAAVLCLSLSQAALAQGPADARAKIAPLALPDGASLYFVFANNAAGKEKEFNDWYDLHLGAISKLPGFVSGQRFIVSSRPGRADPKYRYMATYVIAGDVEAAVANITAAVKAGRVVPTDHVLMPDFEVEVYKPVRPAVINTDAAR